MRLSKKDEFLHEVVREMGLARTFQWKEALLKGVREDWKLVFNGYTEFQFEKLRKF